MSFPIEELRTLGFDVEPSDEAAGIYHVSGYGLTSYLAEGEEVTALLDPDLHRERVFRFEHPEVAAAITDLAWRGIKAELDLANRQILVTKPGDSAATAMTPAQFRDFVEALPPYDRMAAFRSAVQAAASLADLKAALRLLADELHRSD